MSSRVVLTVYHKEFDQCKTNAGARMLLDIKMRNAGIPVGLDGVIRAEGLMQTKVADDWQSITYIWIPGNGGDDAVLPGV